MVCKIRTVLAIAALAFTFGLQPPAQAQDSNARTLERKKPSFSETLAGRGASESSRSSVGVRQL